MIDTTPAQPADLIEAVVQAVDDRTPAFPPKGVAR